MDFGSTENMSASGLVMVGSHAITLISLIQCHVSVGFWMNAGVHKLLPKQLESGCWADIFKFTTETALSVLQKHLPVPNCVSNNICLFFILRFFLPSVIPLKGILVKKWTSYSQRIWHWQNEALPYKIRKHNCSMSKKKSLLFVLEHISSFLFFFLPKPSLLDWYQSIISCWLSCLPLG